MKRKRDSPDANDGDFPLGAEFDVFLCFTPDTCFNFVDSLYHSLLRAGIRVFRVDQDIGMGELIGGNVLRALKSSKMYMPIFSKSFAFVVQCLRVLARMVECTSKANDKVILPIFYEVYPDDVKLKTELYVDALENQERKHGCDQVLRWKEALRKVAGIQGLAMKGKG